MAQNRTNRTPTTHVVYRFEAGSRDHPTSILRRIIDQRMLMNTYFGDASVKLWD